MVLYLAPCLVLLLLLVGGVWTGVGEITVGCRNTFYGGENGAFIYGGVIVSSEWPAFYTRYVAHGPETVSICHRGGGGAMAAANSHWVVRGDCLSATWGQSACFRVFLQYTNVFE